MRKLNVLMVMCGNAGTAYWRMYNWWEAAHRTGKSNFHVLGWDKNEIGAAPWQFQIGDPAHQPRLFGMLYNAGVQADVIIFQRLETEWALTTFYAMRDQFPRTPILSEIDDDITDIASYNPASEHIRPGSNPTKYALAQFRNSDALIVSTPYLKEVYSEFCPHIYVVPNSIDVQKWDKAKRRNRSGIRIGWMGGASHAEDLRILESVIPRIVEKNRGVKFVFNSSQLPEFLKGVRGVEVVEKWSPIMKYPAHIASLDFDIGLAPLRDNKFNRAKSNLRWLEFAALGIPCIASNVGHFKETVRHGEDGLLASSPDEFAIHIQSLISDSKRRRAMGRAAHARIVRDFNVDKNVDIYIDAISDVLTRPPLPAPTLDSGFDDSAAIQDESGLEFSPLEVTVE